MNEHESTTLNANQCFPNGFFIVLSLFCRLRFSGKDFDKGLDRAHTDFKRRRYVVFFCSLYLFTIDMIANGEIPLLSMT